MQSGLGPPVEINDMSLNLNLSFKGKSKRDHRNRLNVCEKDLS